MLRRGWEKVTLEENIQQLRDSLAVTSAQTLRHETRIKEHQQWLEQMELAFARMAARHEIHEREMADIRENGRKLDERIDQIAKNDADRGRALDDRIDKLVSAIGKMISKRNGKS
jgi:chromosome segregation ATPase